MTKSERLMHVIHLLRTRRVVSLPQLSSACGVSQRTIYRDIETLSKMNVPVYYDNGYRLARDTTFPFLEFGPDDLELICYCLRNNPLAEYPFFARRFRLIERKVVDKLRLRTGNDSQTLFQVERDLALPGRKQDTTVIDRFLRGILERRKIEIGLMGRGKGRELYIPVSIRVKSSGPSLMVALGQTQPVQEITASDVREIRVTDFRFDQSALDHLRSTMQRDKKKLTTASY